MSNLSKRIEKASKLKFVAVKTTWDTQNTWSTQGSQGDCYVVTLSHSQAKDCESNRLSTAFFTECHKYSIDFNDPHNPHTDLCQGNDGHTVCYHALGKIIDAYKGTDKELEFYETYQQANNIAIYDNGDKLAKVFNGSKKGIVWLLIKDKATVNWPFTSKPIDNITLMRGPEEGGID